jgi:flagellar biosynthesis protein FliQ
VSETDVIEVVRSSLITLAMLCAPVMLAMMVLGTIISVFQAVTQISEQTLAMVPKILLVFGLTVLLAPFMLSEMSTYFEHEIMDRIVAMGGEGPGP